MSSVICRVDLVADRAGERGQKLRCGASSRTLAGALYPALSSRRGDESASLPARGGARRRPAVLPVSHAAGDPASRELATLTLGARDRLSAGQVGGGQASGSKGDHPSA